MDPRDRQTVKDILDQCRPRLDEARRARIMDREYARALGILWRDLASVIAISNALLALSHPYQQRGELWPVSLAGEKIAQILGAGSGGR